MKQNHYLRTFPSISSKTLTRRSEKKNRIKCHTGLPEMATDFSRKPQTMNFLKSQATFPVVSKVRGISIRSLDASIREKNACQYVVSNLDDTPPVSNFSSFSFFCSFQKQLLYFSHTQN